MPTPATASQTEAAAGQWPDCVELGEWTKVPFPLPGSLSLKLKKVDQAAHAAIKKTGVLTFHTVGCTGCHADQLATGWVAAAMAVQVDHPHRFGGTEAAVAPAFLYHLGDLVYKKDKETAGEQSPDPPPEKRHDFAQLYNTQLYAPYAPYAPAVFALAGNHDGKDRDPGGPARKSAIHHFLKNFCGLDDGDPSDKQSSGRLPMTQPYPYWLLETPLAYVVGLYTNVNNAGLFDDPQGPAQPQFDWLVQTLRDIKAAADGKAVLLALHYPPYSAAANFAERGDPNLGPTPRPAGKSLEPLGVLLQRAFRNSGQLPDAVFSAHAHLYQRLTYTDASGRHIPYLIAGAGGHAPVEKLSKPCLRDAGVTPTGTPPQVVYPPGLTLPAGDKVELAAFNDQNFGFLRITVDGNRHTLTGEYFTVSTAPTTAKTPATLADSFTLDLRTHSVR